MPNTHQHALPSLPRVPLASPRSKSAAEGLKSAGGDTAARLQQLKEQAAAATSTLGEKVQAAQELAKATAEELKKQNLGAGAAEPQAAAAGAQAGAAGGGEQQQQQEQQHEEAASAGAGAEQQASGKPGVQHRLRSFASAAVEEIVKVLKVRHLICCASRSLGMAVLGQPAMLQRGPAQHAAPVGQGTAPRPCCIASCLGCALCVA